MPPKDTKTPTPKPIETEGTEVESNHNTVEPAKPLNIGNITDPKVAKPDYNPMRREGSFANVQSDTSMSRGDNEAVVEEKGGRPAPTVEEAIKTDDPTVITGEEAGHGGETDEGQK